MYLYFCVCPLNNDPLNLHTNPYNISVTQQHVSLVSLGVPVQKQHRRVFFTSIKLRRTNNVVSSL